MPEKKIPGFQNGITFTLRRSRIIFLAVMLFAILSVIWPGLYLFSGATPFILGFPLSFAWVILWVVICFSAMMGLYLSDKKHEKRD
jgi:hypothetical protein